MALCNYVFCEIVVFEMAFAKVWLMYNCGLSIITAKNISLNYFPFPSFQNNLEHSSIGNWPPLWSSGQSSWLQIRRPGFDSPHYQKKVVGLKWGPLSHASTTEELLDRKVAAAVYKTENTAVGSRHAGHVVPSIR
jgi:hypothetical protein